MKYLRKVAGITIFLVGIFMILALIQYQTDEESSLLSDKVQYYFNDDWCIETLKDTETSKVSVPYTGKHQDVDKIMFNNILPMEYAGLIMNFSSVNASVRVFLDGDVIYQQEQKENNEHFVDIPDIFQDGELCIELTILDQDMEAGIGEITVETRDMIVIGLVGNNLADIVCCMLMVIVAIIMFVLALIRYYTRQPSRGELFVGLFSLVAGAYCFIETGTLNIFFYNVQKVYVVQEYLMLMLSLFLVLYFEWNLRMVYPHRFACIECCVLLNVGIQILLQRIGLQNLSDMAELSSIIMILICATTIVSLIQLGNRNRHYQILLAVVPVFLLLSGELANLILHRLSLSIYSSVAQLHSMTGFGVAIAILHVVHISKEYRFSAEEKIKAAEQQNILLMQAKKEADIARHEALAANEAKGKFLAHMSHEIRTPINAVLGMDEMILRESQEQNIKEYAMDIYTAGQSLLSLINDILDFSKIDSGKMEIVPVEYDISSLIHDLINMTAQRAADKNIKFEVEIDHTIPARLYGDDVRIRQIAINLLTNAVKYTHTGTVWLRVQSYQTEEERVVLRFEVEDTGIGIKEKDLPKLSAEFERIEEDRNRNIEGSGLGMSITIQLLALLGSRLQVESVYGKGSKFHFELEQKVIDSTPIGDFESKVHQMAENYCYNARFYAPNAKILVVDDNAVNRKVLRNLLRETQIQVTDAQSGKECLRLVQEHHYDLIFLDHMMPELDGVETLHYIKSLPECPCKDTPIVVLTANAVTGAKESYLSEGFDDFLSKPIVPEKLENMIKKLLPEELVQSTIINETQTDQKEKTLEDLPLVEGLDWNYAWIHLPDMELLEYTVKEFYTQIVSAADDLEQEYKQIADIEHLEQYRIQVHAMKSLAATVGIVSLFGIARVLEYAAKDGKIDVILSMTPVFLEEWRSYQQKLQGVFGIGTMSEKKVTDYSVIQALVEMVRISMQEMDIDKADPLVEQLCEYEYPEDIDKNIQKLVRAVKNLDLEEVEQSAALLTTQVVGAT